MDPIEIASGLEQEFEAYGDRLTYILGRLSHLRADMHNKTTDSMKVSRQAWLVLDELRDWHMSLPRASFKPQLRPYPELPQGHGNFYHNPSHAYNNVWICHIMNQYLCAKIVVLQILSPFVPGMVRWEIHQLTSEIRANIPFHFDIRATGASHDTTTHQFTIRGLLLLWPLVVMGTTEDEAQWAKDCLRVIGERMGIRQSLALERGGNISRR